VPADGTVLLDRPSGDFGTSRFKGTYILRDLTRGQKTTHSVAATICPPQTQVVLSEDLIGIPELGTKRTFRDV
jgi:hypothetical protein